jgi:Flp pilus assembly protein TadG
MRRSTSEDTGAAAVEFALVLPFLLAVLLGIIDFGFYFSAEIAVTQAAREGARVVALGGTSSEATARANATMAASGQISGATTTVLEGCDSGEDSTTVRVEGVSQSILVPPIGLVAEAVMRCTG